MRKIVGLYRERGQRVASTNLRAVMGTIAEKTGLPNLEPGTFNVQIGEPYLFEPDYFIEANQYNGTEWIKLKRCRLFGKKKCLIARPMNHEIVSATNPQSNVHQYLRTLELTSTTRLSALFGLEGRHPPPTVEIEVDGDEEWWGHPDEL